MSRWTRSLAVWLALMAGLAAAWGASQATAQGSGPNPRFGAVEAFWDPQAAVEAGVGWERILFYWSQIQPSGPDDWNTLHVPDEWLQTAAEQGREVVGLLKNTPAWAAESEPSSEASPPGGLDLPIEDPANLWAAFCRRVAGTYGPRGVQRWIIWNEPDIAAGVYGQEWAGTLEQYYRLVKVAYLAIKGVDPAASVHLAGLTFWHDRDWLRRFLAVAAADPESTAHGGFFDAVSLHIYFQTDTVDYIVNEARAALAAYGLAKPIWINETNASPDGDPLWPVDRPRWRVDLREQGSFILQAFALGLAAGAERIAVYKLMDVALPPGGEPFGLLRPDHSRRPAYGAFQLASQRYAGTTAAWVARDPLWAQVVLSQGGQTTRILWARTAADVTLWLPALSPQARLIDQAGGESQLDASQGGYQIALPGARCEDVQAGCFIGGVTYLLVEAAPAEGLSAPQLVEPTQTPLPIETPTRAKPDADPAEPSATPSEATVPAPTATRLPPQATELPPPPPAPTQIASTTPGARPSETAMSAGTPAFAPARPDQPAGRRQSGLLAAGGAALLILIGLLVLALRKRA